MKKMNPSVMVFRLDLEVSGTCGGWNCVSSTPLGFLEYLGIYRHQRQWRGLPRRPQPIRARPGPLARPGGLWAAWAPSWLLLGPTGLLLVQKQFSKKFRHDWTPFGTDILRSKK